MTAPAPRILIANVWHDDNKGDSAIVLGTIRLLRDRWPTCSIAISSLRYDEDAVRHLRALAPDASFVGPICPAIPGRAGGRAPAPVGMVWWALRVLGMAALLWLSPLRNPLRRALGQSDVVVLAGGSNLFDTGAGFGMSSLRLLQFLLPGVAAIRSGRRLWALGHTLGPFDSPLGSALAGAVLRRAELVVVRESSSLAVASSLGVDAALAADMALRLPPRRNARVDQIVEGLAPGGAPFVAVTVRRAPYGTDAEDAGLRRELVRAMERMLASRPDLCFVVVAHVLGPTALEDDRVVSRHLVEEAAVVLGPGRVRLLEDDLAPDELAAVYGAAEVVVGQRFHSVLLALSAGTPAFAISYFTTKAGGVMSDLGLGEFHSERLDVDGERLGDGALALCTDATRQRVLAAVENARGALEGVLP